MKGRRHRRRWIRLSGFTVMLIAVLGIFSYTNYVSARDYKRAVEHNYQRSLSDLSDYVNNIQVTLNKGIYANTPPMVGNLANSLWKESAGAKSSLGQLPVSELQLENTYRFLSQVGEYSLSLSKKTANGEKLSEDEHSQMLRLSELAQSLSKHISQMRQFLDDGSLQLETVEKNTQMLGDDSAQLNTLADGMTDAEESMVDYPTLVYDGPFSDHIMNRTPKLPEGKEEITNEQARKIAAGLLGVGTESIGDDTDEAGIMPSYGFSYNDMVISITKQGGYLCYIMNSRYVGEAVMTQEEAVKTAAAYLSRNGFSDMKESYYMTSDGVCVVNFAYTQDDIIIYPDLVKVGVALDTGEILSVDARGYLMNHTKREIASPKFTYENARSVISPYLTVLDYRKAVIPTPGGSEEFCYEFHCRGANGDEVLVYVNTQTCVESRIFLLLYSDGGVLTK